MYRSLICAVSRSLTISSNIGCSFHTTPNILRESKKWSYTKAPALDDGTEGERIFNVDAMIEKKYSEFPDETSHLRLFDGVPFNQLPICNIRVSPNNTIINITNAEGRPQVIRSCGIEGFKNTRKGTNIAAQATAITLSTKVVNQGVKNIRVRVQGLGPGRMSAIKGLQMGGLSIVSITDNTKIAWQPRRPRKARRL